jgi:hypothetical protein
MTHFAVYDKATGIIRRHGSCAPRDLALQAQDGEAVIETPAPAPGDRFMVDVNRTPPVLVPKQT